MTQDIAIPGREDWTATGVGVHNTDLPASTMRYVQGGSWKQQRIAVVIPAGKSAPTRVFASWWQLIFPPNQAVYRHWAIGDEVGIAYSKAIQDILAHPELREWEYVLTIEHDNVPPADGVVKLVKQMEAHPEYACIGGLYWTKGETGCPQIWGDVTDPVVNFRPQAPRPGELVECVGTGQGFNLFRMSMFRDLEAKKVPHPWFKTRASAEEGVGTQDLYFWGEIARPHGYRCAIDCSVLVGHMDPASGIIW